MGKRQRNTPDGERLTWGTKIGFGVGDIYGGGAFVLVSFMYLFFLTDVVGIKASIAGLVLLISKIWDAVSDPIMGYISDRTRTKWGRRRPFFIVGIPFVFLSTFMLWYPVAFESESFRALFALVAYLSFSTAFTMVMVPYNALATELTLDYDERTSVSTVRIFCSSVSSLICAVVPYEIVKPQSEPNGYVLMSIIFGLFFALPFIAVFLATRERPELQLPPKPFNLYHTFIEPFGIPPFRHVLMMFVFAFAAMDALMAVIIYYMTHHIGRGKDSNIVLGVLLIVQLLSLPLWELLSRRTSKRFAFAAGTGLWLLAMACSLLLTSSQPAWVIYAFAGVVGLSTGGVVLMVYAIFSDIPDIDELHSGERREGAYSGLLTFMRKLGSALALFIIAQLIAVAGYVAPLKGDDGAMIEQAQPDQFVLLLRLIFFLVPVVFLVFSLLGAALYRLTPQLHERLRTFLAARRSAQSVDGAELPPDLAREEEELRAALRLPRRQT